jgi:hypothetical protein
MLKSKEQILNELLQSKNHSGIYLEALFSSFSKIKFWFVFEPPYFSEILKATVFYNEIQNIRFDEEIDVHNSYIVVWKTFLKNC